MFTTKFIVPVVAVACVAPSFAAETDPVSVAKDTIALVGEAQTVLAGVKDDATAKEAVTKLTDLIAKAKKLDKAMKNVTLTPEQAVEISKLIDGAQGTVTKMLEDCGRLDKAKLLSPELKKVLNKFADKTDIDLVEQVTEVEEVEEVAD